MKRCFKSTTISKYNLPIAPNLLNRDFSPDEANQVYVDDITFIWITEGWFYLTVIIDLFFRSVVC